MASTSIRVGIEPKDEATAVILSLCREVARLRAELAEAEGQWSHGPGLSRPCQVYLDGKVVETAVRCRVGPRGVGRVQLVDDLGGLVIREGAVEVRSCSAH